MRARGPLAILALGTLAAATGALEAASLEDRLEVELRGAWVVISSEVYSSCDSFYNDNTVLAGGVSSKARRRFEPGELGKVDRLRVKRSRVDLLITLDQPILASRTDGPFELLDERRCKVQLMFEMPREWLRSEDLDRVRQQLGETVSAFRDRASAQGDEGYNRRRREDYPVDYELTVARHARWTAEQLNHAVGARLDLAVRDAGGAAAAIRSDPEYLEGFAAGVDVMRGRWLPACDGAVSATLASSTDRPPSDASQSFKRGFEDGRTLLFNLRLADILRGCFVPVPDAA